MNATTHGAANRLNRLNRFWNAARYGNWALRRGEQWTDAVSRPSRAGTRLAELDALRGIAALLVVSFHYTYRYNEIYRHVNPLPFSVPLGKYGVELFFGISGFVIFMTLERTRRPLDFVVSRFSRLYPAYWAAMILTTIVVHVGGLRDQQVSLRAFVENVPMILNLLDIAPVDGAYWTLAVELCFYGCMFALYLNRYLTRIEPILVGWIALKWLWAAHFGTHHMSWILGALLIQQYVPFFAIGIVCYRLFNGATSMSRALGIIGFAVLTELCVDGWEFGVVAALVAAILLLFSTGRARWLQWPPLLSLGAISYPLYLLHENIGRTVIHTLEGRGFGESIAVPVAVATALALATLVTFKVERPIMRWIRATYQQRATARDVSLSNTSFQS